MRHIKTWITNAVGHCNACGESLKGDGLEVGPILGDVFCRDCADEVARLVLAREGKVTVHPQFKSDPVTYLIDQDFLDPKGRVRADLWAEYQSAKQN